MTPQTLSLYSKLANYKGLFEELKQMNDNIWFIKIKELVTSIKNIPDVVDVRLVMLFDTMNYTRIDIQTKERDSVSSRELSDQIDDVQRKLMRLTGEEGCILYELV